MLSTWTPSKRMKAGRGQGWLLSGCSLPGHHWKGCRKVRESTGCFLDALYMETIGKDADRLGTGLACTWMLSTWTASERMQKGRGQGEPLHGFSLPGHHRKGCNQGGDRAGLYLDALYLDTIGKDADR